MPPRISIIAANGRVASRVVQRLHDAGATPAVMVRDEAKARRLLVDPGGRPRYGELVVGEIADSGAVRRALVGADVAFLALGSSPTQVALETSVVDAARDVGLPHLVKLSAAAATDDAVSSVLRTHAEIERHLVTSGVPHTLVSPTSFMDIAALGAPSIRERHAWVGTAPDGLNALIDSDDVVDAVTAVLLDPSLRGGTHLLTGPEAVSWTQVARALTEVLGRTITYEAVSVAERRAQLEARGLDEWRVELLLGLDDINRASLYATPGDGVRRLTGHAPRDLRGWLQAHRDLFAA